MTNFVNVSVLQTLGDQARANQINSYFPNPSGAGVYFTTGFPILATASSLEVNPNVALFQALKSQVDNITSGPSANVYNLFILDSSTTSSSAEVVQSVISSAIGVNVGGTAWDLCYLCKWSENCSNLPQPILPSIEGTGAKIIKAVSPYGFQAMLFSPAGLAKLHTLLDSVSVKQQTKPISLTIHDQITAKTNPWEAISSTPNLFVFDPTLVTDSYDYIKTAECRDTAPNNKNHTDTNMSFFWFIVIFILSIILIYFLVIAAPRVVAWTGGISPPTSVRS